MEESDLERLAREELLREAKRGASRADLVGPQGWKKCPVPPANKRFLRFEVIRAVSSSMKKQKLGSQRKLPTTEENSKANKRTLNNEEEIKTINSNHKKKRSEDNRHKTEKRLCNSPQKTAVNK